MANLRNRLMVKGNKVDLSLVLRIFLGLIFITAGLGKLFQGYQLFTVAEYPFLPLYILQAIDTCLPWAELTLGILLISGYLNKVAAYVAILFSLAFISANSYSLLTGVTTQCHCFGDLFTLPHWLSLTIDILMLAVSVILLVSKSSLSGHKPPRQIRLFRSPAFRGILASFVIMAFILPFNYSIASADSIKINDAVISDSYGLMKFSPERLARREASFRNAPSIALPVHDVNLKAALPSSYSLLPYLQYTPSQRNQGSVGNCWVWAGTGLMEVNLNVNNSIKDRLSIQYFDSNYAGWAGCGGWIEEFAAFYNDPDTDMAVPWSNYNANYQDASKGGCPDTPKVPASAIVTTPNYPTTGNIQVVSVPTNGVVQSAAIANIQAALLQNKAVEFDFLLPTSADWSSFIQFWSSKYESDIWVPSSTYGNADSGEAGHAVLCVGYDQTDPDNPCWIMLNSWGNSTRRPNGLFRVSMNMNYSAHYHSSGYTNQSFWFSTLDNVFEPVPTPGDPAKLAFTTQLSTSNNAGVAFATQPVVVIQDASGVTVTSSTAPVTLAITSGTGTSGAVLSGTTTVNAINGIATFSGLSIDLAGAGYTLTASSTGLTSATSTSLDVSSNLLINSGFEDGNPPSGWITWGSPAYSTISRESTVKKSGSYSIKMTNATNSSLGNVGQWSENYFPSSSFKGKTFTLQVWVYASVSNRVYISLWDNITGDTSSAFHPGDSQWHLLTVTKTVSLSATMFHPTALYISNGSQISAYVDDAVLSVTNSLVPAKLSFATQPSSSNTIGTAFTTQPVLTIQDAFNNTVTTSSASVSLAITSGTGTSGAVLSGVTTVNTVNGVATFSGLSINLAGSGYTLTASSTGLTSANSASLNVSLVATKLSFTTQPSSSNSAGVTFGTQPVVTVQDASGNTATTSSAPVTLAITSGAGTSGAVLSGTATVNAVNGVATFSGLSINLAGSGYTLTASSTGLTSATSTALDVSSNLLVNSGFESGNPPTGWVAWGSPTYPAITRDSTTIKSGQYSIKMTNASNSSLGNVGQWSENYFPSSSFKGKTFTFQVWVYASVPNRVYISLWDNITGDTSSAFHPGDSQWHLLTVTKTVSPSAAYFHPTPLYISSGSQISAYVDDAVLSVTNSLVPAKLSFATQPSSSNTIGTAFTTQPVLTIQDAFNNTVTTSSASVSLAITSGTGTSGAVLSGVTTVNAVNGVATFSGLSINLAGSGYTLAASSTGLTSANSASLNVSLVATKLSFTTQPSSSNSAGVTFGTQPVVTVQDASGNTATTSSAPVTLAITSGTGTSGAVLSGTTTVNAVNGVATFSGLSINLAGSGYTLTASSTGLTSATSTALDVSSNLLVNSGFESGNPPTGWVAWGSPTYPAITRDSTTIKSGQYSIKMTNASNSSLGNVGQWSENYFPSSSFKGKTFTFQVWVYASVPNRAYISLWDNITGDTSSAFHPGDSQWHLLTVTKTVSPSAAYFHPTPLYISSGSQISAYADDAVLSITSSPVAAKLSFTTQPGASNTPGVAFSAQPVITIQDASGSTVITSSAPVTLAITSGTGTSGAVLSGTATVNAVNGVAAFNGLSINLAGAGYTLTASSTGLTSATSTSLDVSSNLLVNSGFESGNPPTGWVAWGSPTYPAITRDSTTIKSGQYSMKMTNASNGSLGNVGQWSESYLPTSSFRGKIFTLQVWVYASVSNRVYISLWDNITGDTSSAFHPGDSQWHLLTVTKTISPSATMFHPTALYISNGSQISAYADDASLSITASLVPAKLSFTTQPGSSNSAGVALGTQP